MSALPPKADKLRDGRFVRLCPLGPARLEPEYPLLARLRDDLVGASCCFCSCGGRLVDALCVLVDDQASGRARSCRCAIAAAEGPAVARSSVLLQAPPTLR